MKKLVLVFMMMANGPDLPAQNETPAQTLSKKQKSMVAISALTAKGNVSALNGELNTGLDAGLTVNEIKEIFIHLAAYCGFPRSLNGINTFVAVTDSRKARGKKDKEGAAPNVVPDKPSKYNIGKKQLEQLTGRPETGPKKGYAAFVPAIDTMLKEHLFADIFGRGVLSNQERELVTVSALVSMGGVQSQLQSHLVIAMRTGLSSAQLKEMVLIEEKIIGKKEATEGKSVLKRVLK